MPAAVRPEVQQRFHTSDTLFYMPQIKRSNKSCTFPNSICRTKLDGPTSSEASVPRHSDGNTAAMLVLLMVSLVSSILMYSNQIP